MEVTISNEIIVKEPSAVLIQWARENLVFENPEYINRTRRGLWTGNTDRYLTMYKVVSEDLVLPCGVGKHIRKYLQGCRIQTDLADNEPLEYGSQIPLYDYQIPAVMAMKQYGCGILQSPCGSGKTQMGIALAASIGRKTLWVTHTQDLLNQSYDRASQYFGADGLGKITGGKVELGRLMTFATVQTLSKIDLAAFKYTWDVIIVDECHRLSGTPASVTMFYRVMSNLAARYKYGLSATVYRSDGLIRTTFAILGEQNLEDIHTRMTESMDETAQEQAGTLLTMASNVDVYGGKINKNTDNMVNKVMKTLDRMPPEAKQIMVDTMNGMLKGIEEKEEELYRKAEQVANNVINRLKRALKIHSPSRATREIFQYVMKGNILGLEDNEKTLYDKAQSIADNVVGKFAKMSIDPSEWVQKFQNAAADRSSGFRPNQRSIPGRLIESRQELLQRQCRKHWKIRNLGWKTEHLQDW